MGFKDIKIYQNKGIYILIILFFILIFIGFKANTLNLTGLTIYPSNNLILNINQFVPEDTVIKIAEYTIPLNNNLAEYTSIEINNQTIYGYNITTLNLDLSSYPLEGKQILTLESNNNTLYSEEITIGKSKIDLEQIPIEEIKNITEPITNFTLPEINKTIPNQNLLTFDMENMICKDFEEDILWSSGFSHEDKGSVSYHTWIPKFTCKEAGGQDCFLQDVSVGSRMIYTSVDDNEINGKSYVQISNLDKGECDAPEKGVYNTYLAYESVNGGEEMRKSWYCGYEKEETNDLLKSKPRCGIKFTEKLTNEENCYGIKASASQSMIIDVFKIKYRWCWDDSYGDSSNEIKKRMI